ncbi:Uma2 family endonuclease [Baaleninema simplex]|uniref:Uma2 family endonuclease n=1 Tax=Baaleninema simplex TaxID=2862350 RepID=UPI00034794C7|nr:Uma2 family endonuclease [Baaleninema simplex]
MALKVRQLTVDEYHRMAEVGILHPDERVELLDGKILKMSPIGARHAAYVNRIVKLFLRWFDSRASVSVQNPIILNEFSEPQPDVMLLRFRENEYYDALPTALDVYLVVEVAESTLEFDRSEKLPRYALAEIPEVWIVDTNADRIEVYRNPVEGKYQSSQILKRGDRISILAFSNREIELNTLLFEE